MCTLADRAERLTTGLDVDVGRVGMKKPPTLWVGGGSCTFPPGGSFSLGGGCVLVMLVDLRRAGLGGGGSAVS